MYKLTVYGGRGRLKLSSGKAMLPGRKQVFRMDAAGEAQGDVLAREGELLPGRPLLQRVMHRGRRTGPTETLEAARARAAAELAALPEPIRNLVPAASPYPVQVSQNLQAYAREVAVRATRG